jgi:hypothetical protein
VTVLTIRDFWLKNSTYESIVTLFKLIRTLKVEDIPIKKIKEASIDKEIAVNKEFVNKAIKDKNMIFNYAYTGLSNTNKNKLLDVDEMSLMLTVCLLSDFKEVVKLLGLEVKKMSRLDKK